jgi:co-chaperonin GroES (HSP10)
MKKLKTNLLKSTMLHDFILLTPFMVEEVQGVVKRPQQYDDKPEFGEVISVGNDTKKIKKGDVVLFQKYSSEKVRDPETGVDYMIVKEEDVRCIL